MERLLKDVEIQYGKEAGQKSRDVVTVVRAKIIAKNLFAWRHYIDEVLIDLVGYMIATRFEYSGGAYVACGMQSAIDHCRYCNAAKRRGNYETLSLDEFYQAEDEQEDEKQSVMKHAEELCFDIQMKFGKELADELRPFLMGYETSLSKELLKKLKSKEFMSWFKEYRGM